MKQATARVISNKCILPSGPHRTGKALASNLMQLYCPEIAQKAKPGQFIMVRCGDEIILPRPFSIHSATVDDIALFFAVINCGKGSQWLSMRQDNETVEIFGPSLGNGFLINPRTKNLLLVAGGMGLAPLCFLAQQAIREKRSVTLLLGAAIGPLYTERPENLLPPGIKLITATEEKYDKADYHGLITDLVPDYTNWADQVFACGPVGMYRAMAQIPELESKQVQISLEVRMGCGRGICYSCTIKTKQGLKKICQDGPVFNLDDIPWDELTDIV
ncbi:MAG: dihydroorotate dehydrogenase electron transfer subunit [Dehalococcoidales bacterium]|nr:dihydroorotate dehydrogenase electron transfer subunit [Dehalococcoidales bacterium]